LIYVKADKGEKGLARLTGPLKESGFDKAVEFSASEISTPF
jgi:hypothetical protein